MIFFKRNILIVIWHFNLKMLYQMWQIFVSQNMSQMFVYKNSKQYVYTT